MDGEAQRPIVLVGLMGSGKTTVGKALAEHLGFRFVDNDAGIETEYDATVEELEAQLGIEEAHRIEARQLLRSLQHYQQEPIVVAAAGSVVEDAACRRALEDATVVWLRASPDYLASRLSPADHRPLLGLEPEQLLAQYSSHRRDLYAAVAGLTVDVAGRSVADIVAEITAGLDELTKLPRMYTDLADWFPLITAPEEYEEEAAFYWEQLRLAAEREIGTILELGSGGGNNASHLKRHASLTLVDLSVEMLTVSRALNPECEHVEGDMRSVRLGRVFDAVFVHDAVSYLTTEADLTAAMETAFVHCAPGGAVIFAPDYVAETFREGIQTGGHGDGTRRLRYEEHDHDPDPTDSEYVSDMTYRLEVDGEPTRIVTDRHRLGLFPRNTWLRLLEEAGFQAAVVAMEHSELPHPMDVFVGAKPH